MIMHPPDSAKKQVGLSDTIAMPWRYPSDTQVHPIAQDPQLLVPVLLLLLLSLLLYFCFYYYYYYYYY